MGATLNSIENSTTYKRRYKTYKRELAAAVLVLWCVVSVRLFWYTAPDLVNAFNGPYSTLTMAMLAIVGFAIGAEWVTLQSPWKQNKAVPNV